MRVMCDMVQHARVKWEWCDPCSNLGFMCCLMFTPFERTADNTCKTLLVHKLLCIECRLGQWWAKFLHKRPQTDFFTKPRAKRILKESYISHYRTLLVYT